MSLKKDAIEQTSYHGSFKHYIWGYILSIILTLGAYFAVEFKTFSFLYLLGFILLLALGQTYVQLEMFLHLSSESKPRWNLVVFSFMSMVLLIIVFGSLWIMYDLNSRVMPSAKEMDAYMLKHGGMPEHDVKK
jgi:cytochrome o ubiquinol oxidase operon protein cyoD